jgi:hypothetical protein
MIACIYSHAFVVRMQIHLEQAVRRKALLKEVPLCMCAHLCKNRYTFVDIFAHVYVFSHVVCASFYVRIYAIMHLWKHACICVCMHVHLYICASLTQTRDQSNAKLADEMNELSETMQNLKQRLSSEEKRAIFLNEANERLNSTLDETIKKRDAAEASLDETTMALRDAESELQALRHESEVRKGVLEKREAEVSAAEAKIMKLEADLNAVQNDLKRSASMFAL